MQTQKVQPQEVEIESTAMIFEVADVIRALLERVKTPRLALKLRRLARDVQTAVDDVIEQEKQIMRDCGVVEDERGFVFQTDEDGNQTSEFAFKENAYGPEELRKRRAELYRTSLTLTCVPLRASLFEQANTTLSGRDALVLGELLVDDFDEGEDNAGTD